MIETGPNERRNVAVYRPLNRRPTFFVLLRHTTTAWMSIAVEIRDTEEEAGKWRVYILTKGFIV